MTEGREGLANAILVPAGVSTWAKEVCSLVVVDSMDLFATGGKKGDHFGADKAGGACDEDLHAYNLWVRQVGGGKELFSGWLD